MLIDDCIAHPGMRAVCIREVQRSLEQSVKRLLEDKIRTFSLGNEFRVMNTHIETPGDGIIIFQGMQNHTAESIKSLEGYRRAWVEEAQSLSAHSLTLLRPTIREEDSEIWFSWNPRHASDPVDVFLRGKVSPPNAIVIGTTHRDNPWFPEVLRKEMEWDRANDPDKYAHVWGGGYEKHSEARVFKNWRVEEFDVPANANFMLGADWGFSIDPSTLVRSFEQRVNPATGEPWPRKRLYITHDLYQVGVEIDHMPAFFDGLVCGCRLQVDGSPNPGGCQDKPNHGWARAWPIVADSARPETISYLRRHGYGRMESAKKGAGSVKEGVIFLQGYDIIIHPRCVHTIDEFTNYSYKTQEVVDEATGMLTLKALPILEDKKNHIIDPVRYSAEQLRGQVIVHEAVWG